jgi:hypothetical protein
MPLGPGYTPTESNDNDPRVEIEMEGAEIALKSDDEMQGLPFDMLVAFAEGFDDSNLDEAHALFGENPMALAEMTYDKHEEAAWLAAQIQQHEVQGDPK